MKKLFFLALTIALYSNQVCAQYILHIAGNSTAAYSGDGGSASTTAFLSLTAICRDDSGNLYVGDYDRVRKISVTSGIITTIAGSISSEDTTDNIPATAANLQEGIGGLCVNNLDGVEYLYISDSRTRVRQVNLATGIITTIAGGAPSVYGGDGGPATSVELAQPRGIALDREGNLYVAEFFTNTVRKITAATGIISTVAGIPTVGTGSYAGDGGPATAALLAGVQGVAVDSHDNIYIAEVNNNRIRRVDATTGGITTVAGIGPTSGIGGSYSGDGGPATAAGISLPMRIAFDRRDNMYIADEQNSRIRRVDATSGIITTYAGDGIPPGSGDSTGNNGLATAAEVYVFDLCIDSCDNIFFVGTKDVRAVTSSGSSLAVCGLASLGVPFGKLMMTEFMVWPNPTSGAVTIPAPEAGSFVVYNMVGQQVAAYKLASGATDVRLPAALAAGVYVGVYKADDGGTQQTVRVVVVR